MSKGGDTKSWIRQFLRAEPPRSKSLIVTLLGDSIAPRTRGLWLSELIQLLRPFHVNERLVRTTVFRLAEEGWLEPQRQGRRSRYLLTDAGLERIENAHRRIYHPPPRRWDGLWTVVILGNSGNRVADRAGLRRELEWEGFGAIAPGIVLHPCAEPHALKAVLERLRMAGAVMVLEARDLAAFSALPSSALIAECWELDELAARYQSFLRRFRPVLPLLENEADAQAAFVVQTLLIHSFRRIALHDPRFPAELLPEEWPGHAAYELCRAIYLRTIVPAQQYLSEHLGQSGRGIPQRDFLARFGGWRK